MERRADSFSSDVTLARGGQMAKFYPFAGVEGVGAQSKERKGSNFEPQRSLAIVLHARRAKHILAKNVVVAIWQHALALSSRTSRRDRFWQREAWVLQLCRRLGVGEMRWEKKEAQQCSKRIFVRYTAFWTFSVLSSKKIVPLIRLGG